LFNSKTDGVHKVIPIVAIDAQTALPALAGVPERIYPRSVSGLFSNWRWGMVWLTQIIFYGLPWLQWSERQAVLFDLEARRFYIFGLVLYPQDFIYLTGILVVSALSLFLFTAVAGRLWCGFACPQTVYTEIFLWIEKKVEGDRSARMRRDARRWSFDNLMRKGGKHILWLALALWTGLTFVGYFTPIRELGVEFLRMNMSSWEVFWVFFYALATYGNAGFMREMVCKHMCPYARFQSAMFDPDTLIVTYDNARGEPRGARSRHADPGTLQLGACVDCTLCVQVCPTGIDIRNGLQYECIGCGACVDVCDSVMDKMAYARGLIKYTTENALAKGWSQAQTLRHVLRPRVLIYSAILAAIVLAMAASLVLRKPFRVDVIRDRGVMARIVEGGKIENVYRLQIMNATEATQHYQVTVSGLAGLEVMSDNELTVGAAQARWLVVRAQLPADTATPGSYKIKFRIYSVDMQDHDSEKSVFLVPT
jgi:cytochrome c oxidase accessory protein FixG